MIHTGFTTNVDGVTDVLRERVEHYASTSEVPELDLGEELGKLVSQEPGPLVPEEGRAEPVPDGLAVGEEEPGWLRQAWQRVRRRR